jgi:hypothetical protein
LFGWSDALLDNESVEEGGRSHEVAIRDEELGNKIVI